jgi:hypothetical protein
MREAPGCRLDGRVGAFAIRWNECDVYTDGLVTVSCCFDAADALLETYGVGLLCFDVPVHGVRDLECATTATAQSKSKCLEKGRRTRRRTTQSF